MGLLDQIVKLLLRVQVSKEASLSACLGSIRFLLSSLVNLGRGQGDDAAKVHAPVLACLINLHTNSCLVVWPSSRCFSF